MKNLLIILIGFLALSCEMPTDFSPGINDDSGKEPVGEEPVGEEPNSLYPTVVWNNEPMGNVSGNISASAVTSAPSNNSFFDYRGLVFTATYEAESGEFSLTDISSDDMISFTGGILSGSVSFFSNHTLEVDMLWNDSDGNYYYETYVSSFDSINGWDTAIDSVNFPDIVDDGDGNYEIAFKEIRFIADDGVNYYTWTNPDL